jgi:hypothetical protein
VLTVEAIAAVLRPGADPGGVVAGTPGADA